MSDIWQRWERHYNRLGIDSNNMSRDGIIDVEKFNNDKKILFILKETNKFPGGSLSELLKTGPKYQMWHTLARWAAGILQDFPDYLTVDSKSEKTIAIHQIAVINLKKISGGSTANMSQVTSYAHQDKELLIDQIKSINPKMIIACGTFEPLIWLLDLSVDVDAPYSKPVKSKIINAEVVPWRHPSRVSNKNTYDELKDLLAKNK
jgi:hypothetical protein